MIWKRNPVTVFVLALPPECCQLSRGCSLSKMEFDEILALNNSGFIPKVVKFQQVFSLNKVIIN